MSSSKSKGKVAQLAPLIGDITPMLLSERKFVPEDEDEYLVEVKYDGYRVLAQFGDLSCTLKTRGGADCTKWFPEVSESLATLDCGRMVVDGEMCVLDEYGRTDFDELHGRARRRGYRVGDHVVTYCVFDLLVEREKNIMAMPLVKRKQRLEALITPAPAALLYARHIDASTVDNPVSWLYKHALDLKLEGVVGKRADSPYSPGARTSDWFKLKRPGATPAGRFSRKQL